MPRHKDLKRLVRARMSKTGESYIFAATCERRITLVDTPEYFDTNINQTSARSGRASSGQAPPAGAR